MAAKQIIDFYEILPFGEHNAMRRSELAQELGISERSLRTELTRARKAGMIICTGKTGGYFLPDSPEECKQAYYRVVKRATKTVCNLESVFQWLLVQERKQKAPEE